MATPSRGSDPKPVSNDVVFIDTNLDTHLAIIVSDDDTVSDLKKRILLEHPLCFPRIGQIQIHAIKVKRRGYFYHLLDSMLVKSAFHGFSKSWFLSVDATTLGEHGENKQVCSAGSPNQLACLTNAKNALIGRVDVAINDEKEECPFVNPDVSGHNQNEAGKKLVTSTTSFGNNDTGFPLPGSIPERHNNCNVSHELPSLPIECEVDGSSNGVKDDHNVCEEVSSMSLVSVKKRQKSRRKKEGTVQDNISKEKIASDDNLHSFASKKVSSFNNFEVLQLENKQDEINETPFIYTHVSEHTGEKLVNNLEIGVKSSGNNDLGIPLPDSIMKTQDHHCVNHELLHSHLVCEVDGSSKGVPGDHIECKDGTSISVSTAKKKLKSKRQKEARRQDDTSKENDVSISVPGNDTVQRDISLITNPSENADKEVIKETEVSKEHQHTEFNINIISNGTVTESMKETSEALPAANTKHRKRKRSLTHDCQGMLKVETTSQKVETQKSHEAYQENKESNDQFKSNDDISMDDVEYNHNKVTEIVSDMKPPAKKKRKAKERSGEESLLDKNLPVITDFNVENVSHPFLEVQHIKNSADQPVEHLNDIDQSRTSEHGGRRKGKKKSSNPYEKPTVTSSGKDDEADRSIIQGSVQEENSEDDQFSKGVSMGKTTLENKKIGIDACKEGSPSKVKKTGNYKNRSDIDMKVHPSDVTEPTELPEDNVNFVLECDHKSGAGQIEGGTREALPQIHPKPMLVGEYTPSNQDNTDANVRGLNVTSNVDVNGMAEPLKSEKKNRKKRKSKGSDGGPTLREGISPVVASESEAISVKSLKSINCGPASGNANAEMEENPLNPTEGKIVPPEEVKGIILSTAGEEDDLRMDNAGSMEQIETKADAELVDKRRRKKSNNKGNSALKGVSDMLTKDDVFDSNKPSPSSDSVVDASFSGKVSKKSKSASTKSTNKSSKTKLDPVNGSSQFLSNTPKGSYNLEDAVTKDSTCSPGKQDDNNLEVPLKTKKINSDKKILSKRLQHEANISDVLVDNMHESDREDLDLMNGRNAHKPEETEGQIHAEILSSSQQLLAKDERDACKIHPDKKVPTVHETGRRVKLSSPSNSAISSIREKRKPKVNASEKLVESEKQREREGFPLSNPVLQGSKKMVQTKAGKASQNNVAKVVGKTQQKKSLLAGAIFQDGSSGSSEDVHETDKSDASTRTPSDNSLVSDSSDGDSSAGRNGGKRLENGGSAATTIMSSSRGMTIDHIFRSSSRYKKAKMTASQLEGTESQPEIVPDSLADL